MARKPRLHLPGGIYHVILRGNARAAIFFDDEDRHCFHDLLAEGVSRFGYRVHAFCLMTNHVHLALQAGELPLSRGMQNLAFRYTRYVNQGQQRVGHLFEGRFKAFLVERDRHLLELVRYIHLNPVRARMVADPAEYPHSSHLAYLGQAAYPFLSTDWVLSQFASQLGAARRRYAAFVGQGLGEGHREDFYGGGADGRIVGDDRFAERALARAGEAAPAKTVPLPRIVRAVCRACGIRQADLSAPGRARAPAEARAWVAWLAVNAGRLPLTRVAEHFGRDVSTLSRMVANLDRDLREDAAMRRKIGTLTNAITQA